MTRLTIPDMSCNHCSKAITEAITALDASATLTIDLVGKTVTVQSTRDETEIRRVLTQAGYPPAA